MFGDGSLVSQKAPATQAQAETGTDNVEYMSPLRTAQAIDNKVATLDGTGLTFNTNTEALDVDNPFDPSGDYANLRARATTAQDVGINDVQLVNQTVDHYNGFFPSGGGGTVTQKIDSGGGFSGAFGPFSSNDFTEDNGT